MRSAAYSALRNNASFVSTLQSEGLKRTNKEHPMSCLFIDRHTKGKKVITYNDILNVNILNMSYISD